jgi:hypothetical protein
LEHVQLAIDAKAAVEHHLAVQVSTAKFRASRAELHLTALDPTAQRTR